MITMWDVGICRNDHPLTDADRAARQCLTCKRAREAEYADYRMAVRAERRAARLTSRALLSGATDQPHDVEWQRHGACRNYDRTMWEPPSTEELSRYGRNPDRVPAIRTATWICRTQCQVIEQCRAYAGSFRDFPNVGVWAGEYVDERLGKRRMKAAKGAA